MNQVAPQTSLAQEPLWTQDEAIAFEAAREAIGHVMSIYTSKMADERRKSEPDAAVITTLAARRSQLHRERATLRIKDHTQIARIRMEYGAFVRAWNARQDLLAAE